jgi:peptidoglycan/LPS O-acetylase OafA/YrhL
VTRRPLVVTAVALVLGLLADLATGYSDFPGYAAALGIGGTVLLVFGSKLLVGRLVSRPEDRYPDEPLTATQEDLRG